MMGDMGGDDKGQNKIERWRVDGRKMERRKVYI